MPFRNPSLGIWHWTWIQWIKVLWISDFSFAWFYFIDEYFTSTFCCLTFFSCFWSSSILRICLFKQLLKLLLWFKFRFFKFSSLTQPKSFFNVCLNDCVHQSDFSLLTLNLTFVIHLKSIFRSSFFYHDITNKLINRIN